MAVYDSFKTTRHTYTRHQQSFGPPKYKKDGKLISSQAFNGAQAHVQTRVQREHLNRKRETTPTREPQELVAFLDKSVINPVTGKPGRWRAGVDAHLYFDNIRVNQFLGSEAAFKLRNTRWLANNFNSYWAANEHLERSEAVSDHITVSALLEAARTTEEKQAILTAWGWGAY